MSKSLRIFALAAGSLVAVTGLAIAQQLTVDINRISKSGVGDKIGSVVVSETKGGVSFKVAVSGLPKGPRGFPFLREGGLHADQDTRRLLRAHVPSTRTLQVQSVRNANRPPTLSCSHF
jgi:Cu/Zn superoxide dismutase